MVGLVRRHGRVAVAAVVLVASGLVVGLLLIAEPWRVLSVPGEVARLSKLDQGALEAEKLRQEILQLEIENAGSGRGWSVLLSLAPFITALAAGLGVLATLWKQMSEQARLRRTEIEQRRVEDLRRFDEGFTRVIANLGAESTALRASAAVSLPTFLRPEYHDMHDQVLAVAIANAKQGVSQPEPVQRLLVRAIEQALRARTAPIPDTERGHLLDLSRTFLDRADFSGLDLAGVDVAFASLRNANLTGSNLSRLRGIEVALDGSRLSRANLSEARLRGVKAREAQLHDARCVSARFEDADLAGAEFQRAQLQEAHFQGANLKSAKFNGADLNNAYFAEVTLDDPARRSIVDALNWRKARFDPPEAALLDEIDQRRQRSGDAKGPRRPHPPSGLPQTNEGSPGPAAL
jgi:uncharacterized protein YjbI with pentapeptide repeats